MVTGAPTVKVHREGAFNPANNQLASAGGCRWNDPPLLQERWQNPLGGMERHGGNFIAYAVERWGSKLPSKGLCALVVGGREHEALLHLLAAMPEIRAITILEDPEDTNELEERPPLPGATLEETSWENLNRFGKFHLAVADGSLSRRPDLEECLDSLTMALVQEGLLVVRDYAGPNYYQFDDTEMRLVNGLLGLLPEQRRREVAGKIRTDQEPPPLDWLLANDPASACKAEDLRQAIAARFSLYENIELGGTLLMPLMAGISHNFLDESEECRTLLTALWDAERTLIDAGMIKSDHFLAIAHNTKHKSGGGSSGGFIELEGVPMDLGEKKKS